MAGGGAGGMDKIKQVIKYNSMANLHRNIPGTFFLTPPPPVGQISSHSWDSALHNVLNPFTTEGPAAGPYVNTVSSSDTWLIIITRNLPISIEVIRGDS